MEVSSLRKRTQGRSEPASLGDEGEECKPHLALVLEVPAYLARGEVPDFKEAVHRACDEELAVGGEAGALDVGLEPQLDDAGELCGEALVLLLPEGGPASEQVQGAAGGQQPLVLLPLKGLAQQGQQARGGYHAHLPGQGLGNGRAAPLLAAATWVCLRREGTPAVSRGGSKRRPATRPSKCKTGTRCAGTETHKDRKRVFTRR